MSRGKDYTNIIGAELSFKHFDITTFLALISKNTKQIFKKFIENYDWEKATGEINVNVFAFTTSTGKRESDEITVLYRKNPLKDDWIRCCKLSEAELIKFNENLYKLDRDVWRDYYE